MSSPNAISLLPDLLISQIAAGEVVERPASVLKELLENALDAGARSIQVTLEDGGVKRLQVADDGSGIPREQLALALTRHATSKISSLDDLECVASYGFRGEALASIAAVSSLTLTSRHQSENHAWTIKNVARAPEPAALSVGTVVEMRELFCNTPARRKFLKSPGTEAGHCTEAVRRIALARPDVSFNVSHNGRTTLALPVTDATRRMADVLGAEMVAHCRAIEVNLGGLQIKGLAVIPNMANDIPGRDVQYAFVNRRFVRDKVLQHAAREAYRDVLHGQRQPAWCLFLDIDPKAVDVNVHPAKTEVRFRDSAAVHRLVYHALSQAMAKTAAPNQARPAIAALGGTSDPLPPQAPPPQTQYPASSGPPISFRNGALKFNEPQATAYLAYCKTAQTDMTTNPTITEASAPPLGYAIGQLHQLFVLAQNDKGLVVVDQHAAHERILYEKLKSAHGGSTTSQALLVPALFSADPLEIATAEEARDTLLQLGFDVAPAGPAQLTVRAVPALLAGADPVALCRTLLKEILDHGTTGIVNEKRNALLATLACHGAVRGQRNMSLPEMNALLRQMENTERADQCNHGRPTWIQLDIDAIGALFMRGK